MEKSMSMTKRVNRSRMLLVVLAALVVAGVTGWAVWAYWRGPDLKKYEPVIAAIADGRVKDDRGVVDLSKSFPGLLQRDEMFLTRRADGSFLAMFPTYYGKGVTIGGLMYTSRPLRLEDTQMRPLATSMDRRVISVGSWSGLDVDQRINEHWYRVSRGVR